MNWLKWFRPTLRETLTDLNSRLSTLEASVASLEAVFAATLPNGVQAPSPRQVRRHDCGHESESYATRNGITECEWCYIYRLSKRPQKAPRA